MSHVPFFSVVIPAYNCARWIGATLESFARQTDRDFEVIVVDDGSTDDSARIAESFADRIDIRVLRERPSGAPARPCNIGLAAARGELIVTCDSDDMATEDRLAWMRRAWDQVDRQQCLIFSDFLEVDHEGTPVQRNKLSTYSSVNRVLTVPVTEELSLLSAESAFDALVHGCFLRPCNVAAPRSVFERVQGFNEALRNGQDYDIYLRIAEHFPFLWVRRELALYRIVPGSISTRSAIQMSPSRLAVLDRLLSLSLTPEQRRVVHETIAANYEALGYAYGGRGELRRSLDAYLRAFRHKPAISPVRGAAASVAKAALRVSGLMREQTGSSR